MGRHHLALLALLLAGPWAASASGAKRSLQQAGAPGLPPGATPGGEPAPPPVPRTDFAKLSRGAPPVNTQNGAYVGCFDVTKLQGLAWNTQQKEEPVTECRKYCENKWFAFTIIKPWGACICSNEIPAEAARLADSVCDAQTANPNAVAAFYADVHADARGCRVVSVPMEPSSFRWAYNQHRTSFSGGVMTISMEGSSGARLWHPAAMEYGLVQVEAKISGVSGVVSAFYTRSDTQQETRDFSEIDFEFLNGHPGVPGAIWTNSFKGGVSFGERLFTPAEYKKLLGTSCTVNECWHNFKIQWQPNAVSWIVNNRVIRRNYWGQKVSWCDMVGNCKEKEYRPPDKPSYPTFSMWHDIDGNGAFGGQLGGNGGPFTSSFRNMKMVLCDKPLTSYNGPAWTYSSGSSGAGSTPPSTPPAPTPPPAPKPPTPAPTPTPPPAPAPAPPGDSCTRIAGWSQCGGTGGECSSKPNRCADAAWAGYCCASSYKCVRRDAFYWQCVA